MARLTLVQTVKGKANKSLAGHRASATEGEAARRLLEAQGYDVKVKNGQIESRCPFHEGPGSISKSTNFYVNAQSSVYTCHSASCGERGNLQTLERFFGIDVEDDDYATAFMDRDTRLKDYERLLTKDLRGPFYEHGLSDATIERFRLGYQEEHVNDQGTTIPGRYVIPYLEGRRPKFFRYYDPNSATNGDGKWKYTWETGAEGALFNAHDAMGDAEGRVFLCEGEQKAMMLVQLGYAAVAVPGASMWKDEWQAAFAMARHVYIVFDNDNPIHHNYDKPERDQRCQKCASHFDRCQGHNPGQEAALKRLDQIGWRAKNVVLPWPRDDVRKTDVNDFFMRDGKSNPDFAELVTGKRRTQFQVQTLAEIQESPPDEATFLISNGILPVAGRLLIAGKPKVGKSIFADNLALSLAAGIPFLNRFDITSGDPNRPGVRTLLLDRELSKWSLFSRLQSLTGDRPGYKAAAENLLIDHDHLLRLDQAHAYDTLAQLVEQNGAQVVIMDTAYKFLGGDVESSGALMKAFDVLDRVLHATGCSFVMTHHLKKGPAARGKENTDIADPDGVAGSFLWTGWPNATILLNYLNRSVENPYNSVCTFTAFRDSAPPEPLALYRSRESISYSAIEPFSHEDDPASATGVRPEVIKPTTQLVADLLLECCPTTEDDFLHIASGRFGVSIDTVRPYYVDAMSLGYFAKSKGHPPILSYIDPALAGQAPEKSWEADHNLPERPNPAEKNDPLTDPMFDDTGKVLV